MSNNFRVAASRALSRRLLAGSALGLALAAIGGEARAQSSGGGPVEMAPINVEAKPAADPTNYRAPEQPSLPKLTEPLRDTPQSITTVPRQVMDDQGVTTLRDTLRNVAGVSLQAGEGGAQGDNLSIRGFNARGDIFLDGMRDFGSYYRDSFNDDRVDVLKGPSSILFGRGSTGGVVNQVSKAPELTPLIAGTVVLGTDLTKRATVDVNQPLPTLGDGAAVRLNLMAHENNVAGRDVVQYDRWGFAPSLSLGIGTPTRVNISYLHFSERDIPDYGIPFLLGHPAPVNRNTYYGFKDDFLKTNVDIVTGTIEHEFNNGLKLRNQFRYANYDRDMRATEPRLPATVNFGTVVATIPVTRGQIAVDSSETFLENQTDLTARFETFGIGHTVVGGVEIGRETSDPNRFTFTGTPNAAFFNPVVPIQFVGTGTPSAITEVGADTLGFYALDTLKFGEQWDLIAGVRWDRFQAHVNQTLTPSSAFQRTDEMPSYRGALVYKPMPIGSVYVSYGTSFNPSAEQLALAAANVSTPPEKTETYELGSKWDVLRERLSVRGAIFREDKTNARTPDPNNALLNVVTGEQRVDGFELEANGRLTDQWQIFTGYAYLDGQVLKSNTRTEIGQTTSNTPMHTFNFWTTYDLPANFQIGGGAFYVGARNANTIPDAVTGTVRQVPDYWRFDAMAKYTINENVSVQINIYNLLDKYYIDTMHPAHLLPGASRTALLTTSFRF